jgi:NAD(P)-dependent dehydrogenase (short-subunit alcohol dehydrogenase family)
MYKVLVTGGTSGIGEAIVLRFRNAGYEVFSCARGADAPIRCDVTDPEQIARLFDEIGPVDVLVNNVGGAARTARFLEFTEADWDDHLCLNLKTAVQCTKKFLPAMLERHWGRIVNIASTAGKIGYLYITPYAAAKHALVGFTRALALEVAEKGVTVNAVCPSFVDTPMLRKSLDDIAVKTRKSSDDILNIFRKRNPQNRLVQPEEVAAAVQFFIENPAINGQALSICGGELSS